MKISKHKKKLFDSILNQLLNKKICYNCGGHQSHSLIYCNRCGEAFKGENLTIIDSLYIVKNRTLINIPASCTPDYVAAVYSRKIREFGYTEKEFEDYINFRLKNMNTIF